MTRVALATLGCKVNQVESESIKEELLVKGFTLVDFAQEADIYIINTCTVTHTSDRKSRAMIRRAKKRNPEAIVIAIGCLTQVDEQQLAEMKSVDLILKDKDQLIEWVEKSIENLSKPDLPRIINPPLICSELKPVLYAKRHDRTRAFVKIEDGCDAYCSYCIVPYARGPVRSKRADDVIKEMKQLIGLDYREIVLTGIHTGAYGKDLFSIDLSQLLEKIIEDVEGEYRIRISSLEPLEVSNSLIKLIKRSGKICRHLHIPLQSGSDRILELMNRKYRRNYYISLLESLENDIPGIAITTDVIVGFPGESDKDFENTYELLKRLPLSGMHIFKYSPRRGTPAAEFAGQVGEKVKQLRSDVLHRLTKEKHAIFMAKQVGQTLEVLVERPSFHGGAWGLSDNYLQINIDGADHLQGKLLMVNITSPGCGEYL